jgi:hypothetical protein
MYTLALAVLLGFVAAQVTSFVLDNVPALNKVPVLGNNDNWFIAASILIVWLTDTSILGAYGMGATTQWIDVVGSGLAVAGVANLSNAVTNWFDK